MCPFDMTMIEGCNALGEFLPIILKPEELDQGYRYSNYLKPSTVNRQKFTVKIFLHIAKTMKIKHTKVF